METVTTPQKPILSTIAGYLLEAQQELDELFLQLALGKAEAKDKFDEIKKEFSAKISRFRKSITHLPQNERLNKLLSKFNELDLLMYSEKATTKTLFEAQRKKIILLMEEIEVAIRTELAESTDINFLTNEFEKFKLKLEILRLKFTVKKFKLKDEFRMSMKNTRKELASLLEGTAHSLDKAKEKYIDFSDEISLAYRHFRKALKEL